MKTTKIEDFQGRAIRGPHVKYFLTAVSIALSIVLALLTGVVVVMRIFN